MVYFSNVAVFFGSTREVSWFVNPPTAWTVPQLCASQLGIAALPPRPGPSTLGQTFWFWIHEKHQGWKISGWKLDQHVTPPCFFGCPNRSCNHKICFSIPKIRQDPRSQAPTNTSNTSHIIWLHLISTYFDLNPWQPTSNTGSRRSRSSRGASGLQDSLNSACRVIGWTNRFKTVGHFEMISLSRSEYEHM